VLVKQKGKKRNLRKGGTINNAMGEACVVGCQAKRLWGTPVRVTEEAVRKNGVIMRGKMKKSKPARKKDRAKAGIDENKQTPVKQQGASGSSSKWMYSSQNPSWTDCEGSHRNTGT